MSKRSKSEIFAAPITRYSGADAAETIDMLSVEEPLEIRICSDDDESGRSIAVTMRTPGEDDELAIGFLYTEGIISNYSQISAVRKVGCNVIFVTLHGEVEVDPALLDRHSFIASSCGVCGKKSIEAVKTRRQYCPAKPFPPVDPAVITSLPDRLRAAQKSFDSTGGIHASGLFTAAGELIMLREDVGRHNALDKLIGASAKEALLPLEGNILLVSGRASFELVQKAAHAGITVLAAVGAPSSLAVELAQESGMTLVGFVRGERFNIYTSVARASMSESSGQELSTLI